MTGSARGRRIGDGPIVRTVDQGIEIEPTRDRANGPVAADDDDMLERRHLRLQACHRRGRIVAGVGGLADDSAGPAVVHQWRHLAGAVGHVQRAQHAAHHRDAEKGDREFRMVGILNRDDVAAPQAEPEQGVGETARAGPPFGVGDVPVRRGDGDLVRRLVGPAFQIVRQPVVVPEARVAILLRQSRRMAGKIGQPGHRVSPLRRPCRFAPPPRSAILPPSAAPGRRPCRYASAPALPVRAPCRASSAAPRSPRHPRRRYRGWR